MSDNINNATIFLAIAGTSMATSVVSAATMYALMAFGKQSNDNSKKKDCEDECIHDAAAAPSVSHNSQALTTTHIPEASYNSSHSHHHGDSYFEGPPDVVPVSPARNTTVLAFPGASRGIEDHHQAVKEAIAMTEIAKEHGMKISDDKALEISWRNQRDDLRRFEEYHREARGYDFHQRQNEKNRQLQTKLHQETNNVLQQEANWRQRVNAKHAESLQILSKTVLQAVLVVVLAALVPSLRGGFQSWRTDGYRGLLCGSTDNNNADTTTTTNMDSDSTGEPTESWFTAAKKYVLDGVGIGAVQTATDYVFGDYASCFSQDTLWHVIDVVVLVLLLQLLAWIAGLVPVPRVVLQACQLVLLYGSLHEWMPELPWWGIVRGTAFFWLAGGAGLHGILRHVRQTLHRQPGVPHASKVSDCLVSFSEADAIFQLLPILLTVFYVIAACFSQS